MRQMQNVLTLIANPERADLDTDHIAAARAALRDAGAKLGEAAWLNPGIAADIPFSDGDEQRVRDNLGTALNHHPLDWAVLPVAGRRKKLLVADMDSTIITVECIDEIADCVGLKDKVAAITEAAMRGELDFVGALRQRVAMLRGLAESELERVFRERVKLTPGAETMIRTMNAHGAKTVLVSGGFTFFTDRVAKLVGFQVTRANRLEIVDGKLTGEVIPPIVDAATKLDTLNEFIASDGLQRRDTIAVGDGANDIPMIEAAGLGVAFHAKPKAAAAADVAIRNGDLTALLYLQGFRRDEFHAGA